MARAVGTASVGEPAFSAVARIDSLQDQFLIRQLLHWSTPGTLTMPCSPISAVYRSIDSTLSVIKILIRSQIPKIIHSQALRPQSNWIIQTPLPCNKTLPIFLITQNYINVMNQPNFLKHGHPTQKPYQPLPPGYPQPRLPHNNPTTNSYQDLNSFKQQPQVRPPNIYHPSHPIPQSVFHSGPSTQAKPETSVTDSGSKHTLTTSGGRSGKHVPSFLENRAMKSSLFMGDFESSKQSSNGSSQYEILQQKRLPRMSEQPEMKFSHIEFGGDGHKVPAFLQKQAEKKQKRIPYASEVDRPESSKESLMKNTFPTDSLSNSYGSIKSMKKSRSDIEREIKHQDPTSEWVKRSWNKRKQKKFTIDDFEQIKDLGSGKYGHVFLAKQKQSNFICALKIVQKQQLLHQEITQQFIRELKIQSFLSHPNIIRMYGFFDDPINIYIILEVGTGGQLFKQLKKNQSMPEHKVAGIMRQVCQAVNELHSYHIIHRDIKPENIVLSEGVVKLCDFGWSVYMDQTLRTTFCGTPLYVGPEILKGKEYDEKIDIWSLGVMMYEMLVGENPFNITKEQQLIKIVKDNVKIPSYVEISDEGRNFLFGCLQKNPDIRLSIRECLNHEFFKKYPQKNEKKVSF